MKYFVVLVAPALIATGFAAAQENPFSAAKIGSAARHVPPQLVQPRPPPRPARQGSPPAIPEQFSPPQEAYAAFPEPDDAKAAKAAAAKPTDCDSRLAKIAVFKPLPILAGPGECGAADAVVLGGIILPDRAEVVVNPPATLRCTMAEAVATWLREDVAPAVLKLGAALRGLDNFDSYECRGRNRVRGATLSEHGRANALDVRGFKLANGQDVLLTDVNVAKDWREALRSSACARFSTVLGPGSDGNHEGHIHVDLAERRGNYKMCEWEVREPAKPAETPVGATNAQPEPLDESVPLPRPRPVADAAAARSRTLRSQFR